MSASTPPSIQDETRFELPEESQIPLPSSLPSSPGDDGLPDSPERPDTFEVTALQRALPTEDSKGVDVGASNGRQSLEGRVGPFQDITDNGESGHGKGDQGSEVAVPLSDLLEVMEDDNYQSRRLRTLQDETFGLFHKCGSCDRLLTVQNLLFRRMVECFRNDRKNAFGSLYSKAMSYPTFADLEAPKLTLDDGPETSDYPSPEIQADSSWIQRLSPDSRHGLMQFLTQIRTDPSFVAERISRLSESQLKRLTRSHRQHAHGESVLQTNRSYGRYDPRGFHRSMAKPSEHTPSIDELMGDPLMLLIHGLFDSSSGPQSPERRRQLAVWSSVCCRLIEEGKPGSDDFCITVLNAFAEVSDWPLASRLELFLAELVTSGGPLLENLNSRATHSGQLPNREYSDSSALFSNFFDKALNSLLDLFVVDPEQAVPEQAMAVLRSILDRIENQERRLTARNFFFLRWFCGSFLYNAIVFPETHRLLMDHSLNNSDRQNLLRELILRLQKVVADVLSPWSSVPVESGLESKIRRLLQSFEKGPLAAIDLPKEGPPRQDRLFLFLRPEDVLGVAKSLSSEFFGDSGSNSIFEQPQSRASSAFGLPSLMPGSVPSNIGEVHYFPGSPEINSQQSHTWHANSFGTRSSVANLGFPTFDQNRMARPGSTGEVLSGMEKDSPPPFTHDLWLMAANRDYEGLGTSRGHEAIVLFIGEGETDLSLSPFRGSRSPSVVGQKSVAGTHSEAGGIHDGDRLLLTNAIARIAENARRLKQGYPREVHSYESLQNAFAQRLQASRSALDSQSEYFWWNCISTLDALDPARVSWFLNDLFRRRKASMEFKQDLSEQYEDWLYTLRGRSSVQDHAMQRLSLGSQRLRNKMWFVSDVRHSSAYEDAYNITRALRAMVEPVEQRSNGVAAWAKQRIRNSFGHERVLSQTLELMTAPKTYGGPNKLSESQVQITTEWLLNESIENFCRGEERIHRFCYEIQKCVKRLAGEAVLESPVLWSSPLYQSEKAEYGIAGNAAQRSQDISSRRVEYSYPYGWSQGANVAGPSPPLSLQDIDSPSSFRSGASTFNGSPHSFTTSPQHRNRSSIPRNWVLPPSPISPGNLKTSMEGSSLRRRSFLQNLRSHLTSLLLSDLGSLLWSRGSETDQWMLGTISSKRESFGSKGVPTIADESMFPHESVEDDPHRTEQVAASGTSYGVRGAGEIPLSLQGKHEHGAFPFADTFKMLLRRFSLSPDPQSKLQLLYELFLLAGYSCQARQFQAFLKDNRPEEYSTKAQDSSTASVVGFGAPRTRLTRLQEVAANCEDRRQGSLSNSRSGVGAFGPVSTALPIPRSDDPALVALIKSMFADSEYRPATFFRDLQYIAALTPSSTLDYTPQGTAFWTIGLAAMSAKSTRCKSMTDDAMQILEYHYPNGHQKEPTRLRRGSQGMATMATSALSQQDLSSSTLQDAARLLTISALEGDPTAARELALFHLTHPELVSRVTLPLSRPSDVFRVKHGSAQERGHRGGISEDSGVLDPITFAVVFHWMEFAANAGDADAITFFKENEGLGAAL